MVHAIVIPSDVVFMEQQLVAAINTGIIQFPCILENQQFRRTLSLIETVKNLRLVIVAVTGRAITFVAHDCRGDVKVVDTAEPGCDLTPSVITTDQRAPCVTLGLVKVAGR